MTVEREVVGSNPTQAKFSLVFFSYYNTAIKIYIHQLNYDERG